MSTRIRAKQIDSLHGQLATTFGLLVLPRDDGREPVPVDTVDVTSLFTGKQPVGSDTQAGVFTNDAKVILQSIRLGSLPEAGVPDGPLRNGSQDLYGRLNHSNGRWYLTFYGRDSGARVLMSFAGQMGMHITYVESVELRHVKPSSVLASIDAHTSPTPATSSPDSGAGPFYGTHVQRVKPRQWQTSFTLDSLPVDPTSVECRVNGHDVTSNTQVIGTTVSYDPEDFELDDKDEITFVYRIAIHV